MEELVLQDADGTALLFADVPAAIQKPLPAVEKPTDRRSIINSTAQLLGMEEPVLQDANNTALLFADVPAAAQKPLPPVRLRTAKALSTPLRNSWEWTNPKPPRNSSPKAPGASSRSLFRPCRCPRIAEASERTRRLRFWEWKNSSSKTPMELRSSSPTCLQLSRSRCQPWRSPRIAEAS
ncbi:hypothetical protein L596_009971 [Steinernema carpocapsae]|uniref:Uncharacterized protein n=1 Tax=Steinernema carpocapsae TaxID=34508 RepID=A0A4U5PH46_STECR|nr:hypothetical protein L596_009971 [Steinernema carpocapsae]